MKLCVSEGMDTTVFNLQDALENFCHDEFEVHMYQVPGNKAYAVFLKKEDGTQYSGTSEVSLELAIKACYRLVYP